MAQSTNDLVLDIERMSAIDLINALDRIFPEKCISPMDTIESAHRYAGRRELINELCYIRDFNPDIDDPETED